MLAILDGWGHGRQSDNNAIHLAHTPNMDKWQQQYPFTTLVAHGGAVGLPAEQMGNSEVGHLNIGAGRIVYQDFTRINSAVETGEFFDNEALTGAIDRVIANGTALHLIGLVSDGGVHSHLDHLVVLITMAARRGLKKLFVHVILDGRDTPPASGVKYTAQLQAALNRLGVGSIATISGRYYAMDRDNRWQRIEAAWQALVDGKGFFAANDDPVQVVRDAYDRGELDEFIKPIILTDQTGQPVALVSGGDSVIFFNFRADRARALTRVFIDRNFDEFTCDLKPKLLECVTFTSYDNLFDLPVVFPPTTLNRVLGEEISRHGLKQLRIAETEKYAHVTYFFNGGREKPFALEDRVLIPSPCEVATYDLKPEMSAYMITDELLDRLDDNPYSLVVLNFANGDMVGHSGVLAATVKACEVVDQCLGRLVDKFVAQGGIVLVTADHGNAEIMIDHQTNTPFTAHSSNPVPFIVIGADVMHYKLHEDGALTNIAPTILALLGLAVPKEMTSKSLIIT